MWDINIYSHWTLRKALALAVTLKPLSAIHQYIPESSFLTSKVSDLPVATVWPSFIHVIVGVGFPAAEQRRVALWPSAIVKFVGVTVKAGGTVAENKRSWYINTLETEHSTEIPRTTKGLVIGREDRCRIEVLSLVTPIPYFRSSYANIILKLYQCYEWTWSNF